MTRNDRYLAVIKEAYQGEIYGIALYTDLAGSFDNPAQANKWWTLVRLEQAVRSVMAGVLSRYGIDTGNDPGAATQGHVDFDRYGSMDWLELMRTFSSELDADIEDYRGLLAGASPEDAEALGILLDHELVTKEFCDLEIAGKTDISIKPVEELIARIESLCQAGPR